MNVTLPNGKVIKGVPEGTSKEAIKQKAISAGLATPEDFGDQAQAAPRPDMAQVRQQAMQETAQEVGPLEAFLIGTGKGFMDIGRGIGLADPEDEGSRQAMEALREERPYTTGAGEITGQAAPFVPAGLAAGAIRSMGGRVLAGTGLGAAEGGAIAAGTGGDVLEGTGVGAAIGGGAEILFPVLGRLGRSLYQRVKGTAPKGAMLDNAGRPTPELQSALDEAGITMDDLTVDAQEVIRSAKPGSQPEQVARAARFAQEEIPLSRGTLTKRMADEATEQQLLKSALDENAEPFRQFKLQQSQAIEDRLKSSVNIDQKSAETGELLKDALKGRKNLLRTQKNDLYNEALTAAKGSDIPIFTDTITSAIPDPDTFEDLAITAPSAIESLDKLLTKYGLKQPSQEMLEKGFEPKPLTLKNFDSFRKSLGAIERSDQSGASSVAISPIRNALDSEIDNLANSASTRELGESVIEPLKKAREVVKEMKTEFDPKSLSGRLIDNMRNSNQAQIEASKVYDKLVSKASPVEGIRSTVANLRRAGPAGEQALGALQSTALLDLIEAGFGTASRQIDGIRVFNPNAFRKRLQNIGEDKLESIFSSNPSVLNRMKNIDQIAKDLIPSADAVPKGSAPVLQDLFNRMGMGAIGAKFPGANLVIDKISDIANNYKTRQQVRQAMQADPDLAQVAYRLDQEFPGIAAALGIAGISTMDEQTDDTNQDQ